MSKEHISYYLQKKRLEELSKLRAKKPNENHMVLIDKQNPEKPSAQIFNSSEGRIGNPTTVFES